MKRWLIPLVLLLTLVVQAEEIYISNRKYTYPIELIDGVQYAGAGQICSALDIYDRSISEAMRQRPAPEFVTVKGRRLKAVWNERRHLLMIPLMETVELAGFQHSRTSRGLDIRKPGSGSAVFDADEAREWVKAQKPWLNTIKNKKGSSDYEVFTAELYQKGRKSIVVRSTASHSSQAGNVTYVSGATKWQKRINLGSARVFPGFLDQLKKGDQVLVVTSRPKSAYKAGKYVGATVKGYLVAPPGSW